MVFFMVIPEHTQNSGKPRAHHRKIQNGAFPALQSLWQQKGQAAGDDSAAIAAERRRITSWAMATISLGRTCLDSSASAVTRL
jgi:hypothetical protein